MKREIKIIRFEFEFTAVRNNMQAYLEEMRP